MDIRSETPADFASIRAVQTEAFPTPAEADLVESLWQTQCSIFSLIAVDDEQIVGHAMFSTMQSPPNALGLGPIAVTAGFRRRGIAAALIWEGLRRANTAGWAKVFVLGDPAYYSRFGFDARAAAQYTSRYSGPHLMGLRLQPNDDTEAFGALEYAQPFSQLS
jgi:putative acetyltransferase